MIRFQHFILVCTVIQAVAATCKTEFFNGRKVFRCVCGSIEKTDLKLCIADVPVDADILMISGTTPEAVLTVTSGTFGGRQLQELHVTNVALVDYKLDALNGISNTLRVLNLTATRLSALSDLTGVRSSFPQLKQLHLDRNKLKTFMVDFSLYPNLTVLTLSRNNLSNVDFVPNSRQISKLEKLDLSFNTGTEVGKRLDLGPSFFSNLPTLKWLDLAQTGIDTLPPLGAVGANLLFLNVRRNSKLPLHNYLQEMPNLRHLLAHGTSLDGLTRDSLAQLKFLETLDLSKSSLSAKLFNSDDHPDTANWRICEPFRMTLRALNLSGNIIFTEQDQLRKLEFMPNLEVLALQGTGLRGVSAGLFREGTKIRVLELSNNELKSFPNELVARIWTPRAGMLKLLLGGNHFECDCSISYLKHWLSETHHIPSGSEVLCQDRNNSDCLKCTGNADETESTSISKMVISSNCTVPWHSENQAYRKSASALLIILIYIFNCWLVLNLF